MTSSALAEVAVIGIDIGNWRARHLERHGRAHL
jgi:hypothetical protein